MHDLNESVTASQTHHIYSRSVYFRLITALKII